MPKIEVYTGKIEIRVGEEIAVSPKQRRYLSSPGVIWAVGFALAYASLAIRDAHGAHHQTATASVAEAPVVVGTSAVMTGKQAQKLFHPCSHAAPNATGLWNPTATDIQTMNAALDAFLSTQKPHGVSLKSHVGNYYHQCAGFQKGKHRMIYVGAFNPSLKTEFENDPKTHRKVRDWTRETFDICDGGDLMFGVEYDTETKTFEGLSFNGVG